MVTFWGVLLVLGVLAVARYGADSRGGDPTGRDPAWPAAPHREHSPREDATALARWIAGHRRAWDLYDAALRPWETDLTRRSDDVHPAASARLANPDHRTDGADRTHGSAR